MSVTFSMNSKKIPCNICHETLDGPIISLLESPVHMHEKCYSLTTLFTQKVRLESTKQSESKPIVKSFRNEKLEKVIEKINRMSQSIVESVQEENLRSLFKQDADYLFENDCERLNRLLYNRAVEEEELEVLDYYLDLPSFKDGFIEGKSLLYFACKKKLLKVEEFLIKRGFDIKLPILEAIERKEASIAFKLIDLCKDREEKFLRYAVNQNALGIILEMMKRGYDFEKSDEAYGSLLHCAASGECKTLQLVLSTKAKKQINSMHLSQTPLAKAVGLSKLENVVELIKEGADLSLKYPVQREPCGEVCQMNILEYAQYKLDEARKSCKQYSMDSDEVDAECEAQIAIVYYLKQVIDN